MKLVLECWVNDTIILITIVISLGTCSDEIFQIAASRKDKHVQGEVIKTI